MPDNMQEELLIGNSLENNAPLLHYYHLDSSTDVFANTTYTGCQAGELVNL
jgi:hypothetical protein